MNTLKQVLMDYISHLEEEKKEKVRLDRYRLKFHLMPPVGWLNDPNGLCFFQGYYHVFFQYTPFDAKGGLKVWGHYKSKDLLSWKYEGTPILPDQSFDCHGVYSGSALVEDKIYLFYTGNVKMEGAYDYITDGRKADTICISSEDGIHFGEKQCVIATENYPKEYSCHIRDPKVWKEKEQYYMVLGGRTKEDKGAVIFYESEDKENWRLRTQWSTEKKFGYMWECPDYFTLNEKKILSISPQGVEREKFRYQNIYLSGYFMLETTMEEQPNLTNFKEWDMGFDFYAPQTFSDYQGRRILIGWAGLPDIEKEYQNPTIENEWQHCLTVMRELSVKGTSVYQYPLTEYELLRKQKTVGTVGSSLVVHNGVFDLEVQNNNGFICIQLEELVLEYNRETVALFFRDSHEKNSIGYGRTIRRAYVTDLREVRILVDTSIVEIYLNHGEAVFTTRWYPKQKSVKITVQGESISEYLLWELAEMEVK